MSNQRFNPKYKKRIRNLVQYRNMSDEEFDDAFDNLDDESPQTIVPQRSLAEMEELITNKMQDFEQDYDISDMKINDRLVLRNLIRSIISLEDLEIASTMDLRRVLHVLAMFLLIIGFWGILRCIRKVDGELGSNKKFKVK